MPPDHTYFLHNGFAKYDQPDIVDTKNNKLLRDPMVSAAKTIALGLYPQPYVEPRDIVMRALEQLIEDLQILVTLIKQARDPIKEASTFTSPRMSITVNNGNELLARIHGFDESIGIVIASNAGYLDSTCLHNSAYMDNITMKSTVIRITASDSLDLMSRAIDLAVARTADLIAQFGR